MKPRSLNKWIAVLACLVFLVSCADAEKDEVKIKVIAYNGDFSGWYSIDSGDYQYFGGNLQSNSVYSYEKTVELDDQLEVEAAPLDVDGDISSLEIKIYSDGSLVKSVSDSDDTISTIYLTYTAGETADTE